MKLKHSLIIALSLFGSCHSLYAEVSENVPLDTLLTHYYDRASTLMGEGELDSAQWYFDQAFAAPGVKKSPVYPILLNEQGTLFFYFGELEKSLEAKKAVLPYLPSISDLEKHVSVFNDLGILYHRFNQNDSSIYYYKKALDAAERYQDASWLANLHMNVSVFYFNFKRYAEAEEHIDRALKYVLKTDDQQVCFYTWQVRASIKAQLGKLEESGKSSQEAWNLACANGGNTDWQMRCIPSLYRYFTQTQQPDSIRYYIEKGNELMPLLPPNQVSVTGFLQVRQEYLYNQGKYREALADLSRLNQKEAGTNKMGLYEKMAHCYQQLKQPSLAFAYMDSARMWTDSLGREKVTQGMADFEVKYQTQTKELEIAQLQKQLLKRETIFLRISMLVLLVFLCILFILLHLRHRQQKIKKQLKALRQEKELASARSYIEGMEKECKFFAKELHDGIANDLLGLQMKVETNQHTDEFQELPILIGKIRNEVRNISHELMPPEFELLTLQQILRYYVTKASENTGRQISLVYAEKDDVDIVLSDSLSREIYRIVQEMISNIVTHSSASQIVIILNVSKKGISELSISDNGQPWQEATPEQAVSGIGLRTLQDRIRAIDATVSRSIDDGKNVFTLKFKDLP